LRRGLIAGACVGGLPLFGARDRDGLALAAMLFCLVFFAATVLSLVVHLLPGDAAPAPAPALPKPEAAESTGAPISLAPPASLHVPAKRGLAAALVAWVAAIASAFWAWVAAANEDKTWLISFAVWGLLFLASVRAAGVLTTRLFNASRLGLSLDEAGLTVRRAGFTRVEVEHHAWEDSAAVTLQGTSLSLDAKPLRHDALVLPADWVLARARDFLAWKQGKWRGESPRDVLLALDEQLAGAICAGCGGTLTVPLTDRQPACPWCGRAAAAACTVIVPAALLLSAAATLRRFEAALSASAQP
jgi:hypothetical protein